MTDPEYARARGAQASSELRETEAAFEDVRQRFIEKWADSALGEHEFREKAYLCIQMLDTVKTILTAVASGKDIAEHDELIGNILAGKDQA